MYELHIISFAYVTEGIDGAPPTPSIHVGLTYHEARASFIEEVKEVIELAGSDPRELDFYDCNSIHDICDGVMELLQDSMVRAGASHKTARLQLHTEDN